MDRLGHAVPLGAFSYGHSSLVLAPVADDRPAVVDPGPHHVQLVSAPRPVLVRPEGSGLRMEGEALHVAVPEGEDFGPRPVHAHEGVVGRDAAVCAEPNDAPRVVARVLGAAPIAAVSEGDEEMSVRGEPEPRPEVATAARLREGAEQHLHVLQPAAPEPPARDFRPGTAP